MKVIAHETVGMHLEIRYLTAFGHRLKKIHAIHFIVEVVPSAIITAHDVVDRTGIFDTHASGAAPSGPPLLSHGR